MNLVPVADQSEHEQHNRNEQKTGGLRCVDRMAVMFFGGVVVGLAGGHGPIVAPRVENLTSALLATSCVEFQPLKN